jgi:RNA recognition motif-containing protein
VTFTEEGAIENAISEMNGSDLDGRPIVVNEARDQAPRGGGGGGGGGERRERW